MMNHSSSAANNNNNNQPTSLARTIEALQQQQLQLQQANGPNVAPNGDQNQQSIPLIATQAAAAMAAALAAQQLMASAAAICGIDLASLSNFAILAGQPAAQPGQQSPEQLMAAAMAASTLLSPNHLVPEDLTMANGEVASNGNSAASTPAPVSSPSSLHLYNTSSSTSTSPLNQQQLSPLIKQQHHHLQQQQHQQQQQVQQQAAALAAARNYFGAAAAAANNNHLAGLVPNTADLLALELASQLSQQQQQQQHQHQQQQQQQVQVKVQSNNNNHNNNNNSIISNNDASNHNHTNNNASSNQQTNGQHHTSARHHHHHLLGGHHHHSSIQSQQQLLATRGYNPMAVLGSGQQTEILTPTHLRKAKLMFFYVRYPSSATLKECFRDVRFNKNNTAQLVKWFSNFREFYYIQMEKFARDAVADDRIQCKEDIVVDFDHELINQLNNHYNKNRHIPLPEEFRQVVEETLRHFFDAIHNKRDQEQSWKKAIYKLIARLDHEVPEHFKTEAFNEHLE